MKEMIGWFSLLNLVSIAIIGIIVFSFYRGIIQGATGSARHLFFFVMEALLSIAAIALAWLIGSQLSATLHMWLIGRNITIPSEKISSLKQIYYTFITGIRDFPLMRFGFIFLLAYYAGKQTLYILCNRIFGRWLQERLFNSPAANKGTWYNSLIGGGIGLIIGAARALVLIAVLFIYVTLQPHGGFSPYIEASSVYQKGATQIIKPVSGDFINSKLPVFTRAVESEFSKILQRKYEVIDQQIPHNIADAAKSITANDTNDDQKARSLYRWVGTRIIYDWDKVNLYENKQIWKEQSPEDTFLTKKGVCIDFARLYAAMARAINLQVRVVTGLGYDGQGGYGPHAWNEVYISEQNKWIPLDPTWLSSGGNWYDPPGFYQSHVKDA